MTLWEVTVDHVVGSTIPTYRVQLKRYTIAAPIALVVIGLVAWNGVPTT